MKRILLLSVFFIAILLISVTESYACSCVGSNFLPPLEQQVLDSLKTDKAIFAGKVIKIEKDINHSVIITIKIERLWKKKLPEIISITESGIIKDSCNYCFKTGESYLIYATGDSSNDSLVVSLCSKTKPLNKATEELQILGKGKPPVTSFSLPKVQQSSQELQWKEFSSETGNFKVLFPAVPEKSVEEVEIIPNVKNKVIWHKVSISQKSFLVSYSSYPKLPTLNQEQLRDNYKVVRHGALKMPDSKIISEREIWLDKHLGYELVVELNGEIVTNRMFLVGKNLYQAITTAKTQISENEATKAESKKFLDSFQIIEK